MKLYLINQFKFFFSYQIIVFENYIGEIFSNHKLPNKSEYLQILIIRITYVIAYI